MNMENVMQRFEAKLDDIRDIVHAISVSAAAQSVRQENVESRLKQAEIEIASLKTAHDRVMGVLKILGVPGVISVIWAGAHFLQK